MNIFKSKNKHNSLFLIISIVLFLLSLTQNAFYVNDKEEYYGFLVLIYGFFGVFDFGSGVSWLANVLILISWGLNQKRISLYLSLCALTLGLSFLAFDEILMGTNDKYGKITQYDLGYYLWILSFLIMAIGNLFNYKKISN